MINKQKYFFFYSLIIALFASLALCDSCNRDNGRADDERYIEEGKQLAQKRCSTCHQAPDASLLDKATWDKGILPAMAAKFGVRPFMGDYLVYSSSAISNADWHKIVMYYKSAAPDKLVIPKPNAVKDWAIFSLKRPAKTDTADGIAMTTMVAFNPNDKSFYTGGAGDKLYKWDSGLNATVVKKFQSPVVDAEFFKTAANPNGAVITCIGVLPPNDQLKGKLISINLNSKLKGKDSVLITDSLPRPVKSAYADFNKDGLMDYVSCGFGHNKGGLFLVQQQPAHQFTKKIIRAMPGPSQLYIDDYNNDGWPDIVCLFAQADEGVWLFLNDKKGGFTTQNLVHFPSVYGSSSFQFIDFNNDGKPDILYTCGDNNDYSPIFKPYHGVYIFTNQGNWKFKQTYFYHINGCSKAMAADFDHDGDLDLAVIAFFPDFKYHPSEGFTYHEQTSPGKFKVHEIPVNPYGRWLALDVNDIDGDGNMDIVLGNFSVGAKGLINQKDYNPNWDMYSPITVLHNTTKKRP
ncbi:VCBS repeat-containing protein [Mucilaginibacter sp. OK283]|uniref:FG-GAP repeat domain-containing protein n=1 Tax=Mucilaginibacter sp. OK283 TaxID=1881049 RepID=UPI0008D2A1A8|nr:VCBS repeat-containing protein [Mucilaginibacter sp. OK283]SEO69636.1 Repeat domain-containing protein [Mucilaginibacter sp. OK283]